MENAQPSRITIIAALLTTLAVAAGAGWRVAAADRPNYDLSETQKTRLELMQTKALRANDIVQTAQGQLNQAVAAFNESCEKVKTENHLPKEATCDINNLKIVPPSKSQPQAAAPTPAPPEKKK